MTLTQKVLGLRQNFLYKKYLKKNSLTKYSTKNSSLIKKNKLCYA